MIKFQKLTHNYTVQDLKVTLIQSNLYWQDIGANLAMFEEKIWQIKEQTDLIILPEMFTTGFSMNAAPLAEHMNMTTFKWMKQQAAQTGAVVVGSYIVVEDQKYYNRLIWMQPNGEFDYYDKRHLFRMAQEHHTYTGGKRRIIKDLKGWKIFPLICYDLRFPVWSRNVDLVYDAVIFIANWPKPRNSAWDVLLQARAAENLAYCIGVNRVGKDEVGKEYVGGSGVIDFKGNVVYREEETEFIKTIILEKEKLTAFRKKFPAQLDADEFSLEEGTDFLLPVTK